MKITSRSRKPGGTIVVRWQSGPIALLAVALPLLAACGASAIATAPSPEPTPIVLPTQAPPTVVPTATPRATSVRLQVANTGGDGANLRAEPSTKARVLVTLADGTLVEEAGPERKAEDRTWKNVKDAKGNVGWIAAEFLKPTS